MSILEPSEPMAGNPTAGRQASNHELVERVGRLERELQRTCDDLERAQGAPLRWLGRVALGALVLLPLLSHAEIPHLDPEADFSGVISGDKMLANFLDVEARLAALEGTQGRFEVSDPQEFPTSSLDNPAVTDLSVDIETSGGPVTIGLLPGVDTGVGSSVRVDDAGNGAGILVTLQRSPAGMNSFVDVAAVESNISGAPQTHFRVPPGAFKFFDRPDPGHWTYRVVIWDGGGAGVTLGIHDVRIYAQEFAGLAP